MSPSRRDRDENVLPAPDPAQVQVIRTYGPGRFVISDREWHQPVLVTPGGTAAWPVTRAEEVAAANLGFVREGEAPAELLVLGCGPRAIFVPPPLRAELKAFGLALEVVDTGSACRIYNVLISEGRRVAAALIPL
ncbi:MAG: Mth938-like domain-containing protein [Proteobacteria bacterium]|nr:Mth938-like domain-containing protein [Pseudomonadota bacterium]